MRYNTEERAGRSVLLVIDVQDRYIGRYEAGLVERINRRIADAVDEGMPVLYVLNAGITDRVASPLAEGLTVVPGVQVVKRHQSAFTAEKLVEELKAQDYDTLDIIGIDGCCCVAATALDGVRLGYRVRLGMACVGTVSERRYERKLQQMKAAGIELEG